MVNGLVIYADVVKAVKHQDMFVITRLNIKQVVRSAARGTHIVLGRTGFLLCQKQIPNNASRYIDKYAKLGI